MKANLPVGTIVIWRSIKTQFKPVIARITGVVESQSHYQLECLRVMQDGLMGVSRHPKIKPGSVIPLKDYIKTP